MNVNPLCIIIIAYFAQRIASQGSLSDFEGRNSRIARSYANVYVPPGSPDYKEKKGFMIQYRPGDVLIGGMIPVHKRGENNDCGSVSEQGIQAVETMNMVVDIINSNTSWLPGIKLGTVMVDTCDYDTHALHRIVHTFLPELNENCFNRSTNSMIVSVMGAFASSVSIQTTSLLQIFKISQVSPWSTHPDLSNKNRFPYFFRNVPSDIHQAKAMMSFITQNKWKYISIVYEDDYYGVRGFKEVENAALEADVCIAVSLPISRNANNETFSNIITKLLDKRKARVVVVFTKQFDAENLIAAAHENPKSQGYFRWIGSDGWTNLIPTGNVDLDYSGSLAGAVGFLPKANIISGLKPHMNKLTYGDHLPGRNQSYLRNPWFPEYLSRLSLGCKIKGQTDSKSNLSNSARICRANDRINLTNFNTLSSMQLVADAVLAIAESLKTLCDEQASLCDNMKRNKETEKVYEAIYEYMKNSTFQGINGDEIAFDENQDGPAVFTLATFKSNSQLNKDFLNAWVEIGEFNLNKITYLDKDTNFNDTDSSCGVPCMQGYARINDILKCCWQCVKCQEMQYVTPDGTNCTYCPPGHIPNKSRDGCVIQERYVRYEDVYSLASMCVASLGIIMTFPVVIIFFRNRQTAIVKATGKEHCVIVLVGVILCFLSSFALATPASYLTCVISRLLLALGPTLMYAGLLTKTIRVVIIFHSKKVLSKQVKLFLRPAYQILITGLITSVQALVLIVWFIFSPAHATPFYSVPTETFYLCPEYNTFLVLVGLAFPFLLIIASVIFATKNRKVPTGFNETKYIGFTMYATCVIWLAFLPIFFTNSTMLSLKVATVSICLSLSAITVLVCLFYYRCYVMIFRPHENTSKNVMSSLTDKKANIQKTSTTNANGELKNKSENGTITGESETNPSHNRVTCVASTISQQAI